MYIILILCFYCVVDSAEQQGLQLCPVLARDCYRAVIRGDLRGHWGALHDRPVPVSGPAVHSPRGCVPGRRRDQQGRSILSCSERSWVPQNHDQEVNNSQSRDIKAIRPVLVKCFHFQHDLTFCTNVVIDVARSWAKTYLYRHYPFEMAFCLCASSTSGYAL